MVIHLTTAIAIYIHTLFWRFLFSSFFISSHTEFGLFSLALNLSLFFSHFSLKAVVPVFLIFLSFHNLFLFCYFVCVWCICVAHFARKMNTRSQKLAYGYFILFIFFHLFFGNGGDFGCRYGCCCNNNNNFVVAYIPLFWPYTIAFLDICHQLNTIRHQQQCTQTGLHAVNCCTKNFQWQYLPFWLKVGFVCSAQCILKNCTESERVIVGFAFNHQFRVTVCHFFLPVLVLFRFSESFGILHRAFRSFGNVFAHSHIPGHL